LGRVNDMSELNSEHGTLETYICKLFQHIGYTVGSRAYHHNTEFMSLAKVTNDVTAMIIRTEPDVFVYNQIRAMNLEFKTTKHTNRISIEALPLMHHVILAETLGVNTVYFCKLGNKDFVFETSNLPKINVITIPTNKVYPAKDKLLDWSKLKNIEYINQEPFDRRYGSGDPFITLTELHKLESIKSYMVRLAKETP
jgi:hypothetical protein